MIRVSKEELYSAMGERLRGERTKLGYTQEKMAEKLGMSLTYYGQIERGISGISLEKLVLAHECLNIDPTYLLTGKEAKERLEKQYKRQNEHIKENYDRISITLPKGTKERIKAKGESVNGYITRLVLADLDN